MLGTRGAVTAGIVISFISVASAATIGSYFEHRRKTPNWAGTAIPEISDGLDITKRHEICSSGGNHGGQFAKRLHGHWIVGHPGRADHEAVSMMYMRGRWLVV